MLAYREKNGRWLRGSFGDGYYECPIQSAYHNNTFINPLVLFRPSTLRFISSWDEGKISDDELQNYLYGRVGRGVSWKISSDVPRVVQEAEEIARSVYEVTKMPVSHNSE